MQSGSRGGTNKQLLSTYENYSVQMIDAGKLAVMFSGINICRNAPSVSHLLFVDDSLILCKMDLEEAQTLKQLLLTYEDCSGQMINAGTLVVMFSPNTRHGQRIGVMETLNITAETMKERYLGLPVYIGRARLQVFTYLKKRVWQRIQGWKERLLSRTGKEILIKVIAQAISMFNSSFT